MKATFPVVAGAPKAFERLKQAFSRSYTSEGVYMQGQRLARRHRSKRTQTLASWLAAASRRACAHCADRGVKRSARCPRDCSASLAVTRYSEKGTRVNMEIDSPAAAAALSSHCAPAFFPAPENSSDDVVAVGAAAIGQPWRRILEEPLRNWPAQLLARASRHILVAVDFTWVKTRAVCLLGCARRAPPPTLLLGRKRGP